MYTLWFPFVITPRHGWEFDSLEEAIASGKDAGFTFYVMHKVTDSSGTHNYKAASWCPIRGLQQWHLTSMNSRMLVESLNF